MSHFRLPTFKRPCTRTTKTDVVERYNIEPVYRMSYNESPLGPSPKVVAAIQEAAATIGDYPPMGDEVLRQALAKTWGRGLTADHFFTGCSGYETLELVTRAYLQPGDEMIISPPTFGVYNKIAALQEAKVVSVPLEPPDFMPDIDGILAAVTPRTRLLMICNPNNPTGTMMAGSDMHNLVRSLPSHVTIVADEVYCDFVTAKEYYPDTLYYVLEGYPVIRTQTFSKAYGIPGVRLGYAIAPPEIANYVGGFHRGFHQNRLALAAGVAALTDQAHLQKNVQTALEGKQWLYAQLDRLGLSYIPSQTNFVVVRLHQDATAVAKALYPYGVMVKPLNTTGLENCLRVTISVPAANEQFIRGLQEILSKPA